MSSTAAPQLARATNLTDACFFFPFRPDSPKQSHKKVAPASCRRFMRLRDDALSASAPSVVNIVKPAPAENAQRETSPQLQPPTASTKSRKEMPPSTASWRSQKESG